MLRLRPESPKAVSRLRQFGVKIETGVEGSVAESRGSRLTSGCGTQASPILKTSGGNCHRPIRELELESRPMRGQQGRSEAGGGRQHIEPAGGSLLASLPPDIHVCRSGGATSRHLHKYKHTNTNRQTQKHKYFMVASNLRPDIQVYHAIKATRRHNQQKMRD